MQKELSLKLTSAVLLSAFGLSACKPSQSTTLDPLKRDRLVAVETVGSSNAQVGHYTGVVGARVASDLGFRIEGKITERLVDTGQVVKRGQPLMRMDPTDYTHALVAQSGNVAAARARWIQASADEKRNRGLVATGAISHAAYDQVKAAADSAQALLDAATAQQRVAKNQEDYSLLLADADGTVIETLVEPGQVVAAGQVVVRLAHAGPREAVVNLPETIRPSLNSVAAASLYGGNLQVNARLRQLSDSADPRTRTFEARYVMGGEGAVAPLGATVTIGVGHDRGENLLSVPLGAIDDEGHGPGVWVVDPKTAKVAYRLVHVESLGGETVELSGGVTSGETIVATGGHFLHEDEHVRIATLQAAMQ
jgi:RND family efflux transporter MFP subunit